MVIEVFDKIRSSGVERLVANNDLKVIAISLKQRAWVYTDNLVAAGRQFREVPVYFLQPNQGENNALHEEGNSF